MNSRVDTAPRRRKDFPIRDAREQLVVETSHCARHPQKIAAAHCKNCGLPICAACVLKTSSGLFCGIECAEQSEKRQAQIASAAPVFGRRLDPRRFVKRVAVLAVLCAVFYAVMFSVHGMTDPMEMLQWLFGVFGGFFHWVLERIVHFLLWLLKLFSDRG